MCQFENPGERCTGVWHMKVPSDAEIRSFLFKDARKNGELRQILDMKPCDRDAEQAASFSALSESIESRVRLKTYNSCEWAVRRCPGHLIELDELRNERRKLKSGQAEWHGQI